MRVLVLGDGLLGSEIVKQTNWDYISRKKDGFDITLDEFNFTEYDTIINCIAYTNTYSDDRGSNWNINYKAVANLVDYCNYHNNHKSQYYSKFGGIMEMNKECN